jgi:hypothetical protein
MLVLILERRLCNANEAPLPQSYAEVPPVSILRLFDKTLPRRAWNRANPRFGCSGAIIESDDRVGVFVAERSNNDVWAQVIARET